MDLQQVKAVIGKVQLNDILKDGLCYSEPIMSVKDDRIIDNYFVYAIDYIGNMHSGPIATFGINSDLEEIAYINENVKENFSNECTKVYNIEPVTDGIQEALSKYEQAYSSLRSFLFCANCTSEQKSVIKEYISGLEAIVFSGLWPFYKMMGKPFFDWAEKQLDD